MCVTVSGYLKYKNNNVNIYRDIAFVKETWRQGHKIRKIKQLDALTTEPSYRNVKVVLKINENDFCLSDHMFWITLNFCGKFIVYFGVSRNNCRMNLIETWLRNSLYSDDTRLMEHGHKSTKILIGLMTSGFNVTYCFDNITIKLFNQNKVLPKLQLMYKKPLQVRKKSDMRHYIVFIYINLFMLKWKVINQNSLNYKKSSNNHLLSRSLNEFIQWSELCCDNFKGFFYNVEIKYQIS